MDTIIPVVSARVFGMKLNSKMAHRVDHISTVTGLKENDQIKPEHIAILLSSEQGSLKNVNSATVIPVINMVDFTEYEDMARQAATQALSMTDRFDKVVLAAMKEQQPIVDVISR